MTYTLRLAAIFCGEVQRVLDAASLLAGGKTIAKIGAGVKFIEDGFVECLKCSEALTIFRAGRDLLSDPEALSFALARFPHLRNRLVMYSNFISAFGRA
jgi:hypothetical protein